MLQTPRRRPPDRLRAPPLVPNRSFRRHFPKPPPSNCRRGRWRRPPAPGCWVAARALFRAVGPARSVAPLTLTLAGRRLSRHRRGARVGIWWGRDSRHTAAPLVHTIRRRRRSVPMAHPWHWIFPMDQRSPSPGPATCGRPQGVLRESTRPVGALLDLPGLQACLDRPLFALRLRPGSAGKARGPGHQPAGSCRSLAGPAAACLGPFRPAVGACGPRTLRMVARNWGTPFTAPRTFRPSPNAVSVFHVLAGPFGVDLPASRALLQVRAGYTPFQAGCAFSCLEPRANDDRRAGSRASAVRAPFPATRGGRLHGPGWARQRARWHGFAPPRPALGDTFGDRRIAFRRNGRPPAWARPSPPSAHALLSDSSSPAPGRPCLGERTTRSPESAASFSAVDVRARSSAGRRHFASPARLSSTHRPPGASWARSRSVGPRGSRGALPAPPRPPAPHTQRGKAHESRSRQPVVARVRGMHASRRGIGGRPMRSRPGVPSSPRRPVPPRARLGSTWSAGSRPSSGPRSRLGQHLDARAERKAPPGRLRSTPACKAAARRRAAGRTRGSRRRDGIAVRRRPSKQPRRSLVRPSNTSRCAAESPDDSPPCTCGPHRQGPWEDRRSTPRSGRVSV